jgi:hypothetical protein
LASPVNGSLSSRMPLLQFGLSADLEKQGNTNRIANAVSRRVVCTLYEGVLYFHARRCHGTRVNVILFANIAKVLNSLCRF